MANGWEIFDHTADVGLRVCGPTIEELFARAGEGMFSLLADPGGVRAVEERSIAVEGEGLPDLLRRFLNELLYVFSTEKVLFREFEAHVQGPPAADRRPPFSLKARLRGERLDPGRHALGVEIKAVTWHGLTVEKTADGWKAEVIFDI